ncbi:hypothetical protein DEG02_009505 [Xanthomonas vasicola]|nr:hypothetical protein NX80_018515 [Xanthomonas vasicola pv. arecae]AZR29656.1 hypothetical protein KWO_002905 [Xanthomonas vasicola pv. musacearum NCPPB 4379]AZR33588.1 hypothetical protein NX08_002820 [Xanthomonas vasicola]RRJ41167.1 hypothetical protein EIM46_09395 [Xanthomonas vasicola pv. musacearum]RJL83306.1 hypothetical protein DEG03_010930 [Xanthomonas vasicola]
MRANGARALERPRRKRGPGRGAGVGVRVRGEALVDPTSTRLRPSPHPPLRASFSRWEKGGMRRLRRVLALILWSYGGRGRCAGSAPQPASIPHPAHDSVPFHTHP